MEGGREGWERGGGISNIAQRAWRSVSLRLCGEQEASFLTKSVLRPESCWPCGPGLAYVCRSSCVPQAPFGDPCFSSRRTLCHLALTGPPWVGSSIRLGERGVCVGRRGAGGFRGLMEHASTGVSCFLTLPASLRLRFFSKAREITQISKDYCTT